VALPHAHCYSDGVTGPHEARGWVRVLALLLALWEPLTFAVAAAGAANALSVRGLSVALVLAVRLAATALCVAAGRALLDGRAAGAALARAAVVVSAAVQVFAYVTPWFPSNRLPGQTSVYVGATLLYYGGWLLYLQRSRRIAELAG